jgi:hypothetical protein
MRVKPELSKFVGSVVVILCALCYPLNLDAKDWLSGHIVEIRADGFLLETRFYRIAIHTATDTKVRCKKQSLSLADLEAQDLVSVEGSSKHGIFQAMKVTIHRDWLRCREIKGPKPCHCKC